LLNVTSSLETLAISPLSVLRTIAVELTITPPDNQLPMNPAVTFKLADNANQLILIASKKVSGFSSIKFVSSTIIDLRCAFEDCAPYPHHPLDGLL